MVGGRKMKEQYLGDGLYVRFDGYQYELRANDLENPTDTVYLEPKEVEAFFKFVKGIENLISESPSELDGLVSDTPIQEAIIETINRGVCPECGEPITHSEYGDDEHGNSGIVHYCDKGHATGIPE